MRFMHLPPASLGCLLLLALAGSARAAGISWSDGDGNSGTIASAGWNDIQAAITSASAGPTTRGTVKLSGNFKRTLNDTTIGSLKITNGVVSLSGGWDAAFTAQSGRSTLDVTGTTINDVPNRFRVMYVNYTNAVLDSLVLSNSVMRYNYDGGIGPGVYIDANGDRATLQNLVVTKNFVNGYSAAGAGGGVAINHADGVRVTRCTIASNTCCMGGGIYILGSGTAADPVVIEYTDLVGNKASQGDPARVDDLSGGAMLVDEGDTAFNVVVANCRLLGNSAEKGGTVTANFQYGRADSLTFFGCLIATNYTTGAANLGTVFYLRRNASSGARFVNCTVVDNYGTNVNKHGFFVPTGNAGSAPGLALVNSIAARNSRGYYDYRKNSNGQGYTDFQSTTVSESRFFEQDDQTAGETNIDSVALADAIAVTSSNAVPAYRTRTSAGALANTMQANIDGDPSFLGQKSDPYQLADGSNSRDNGTVKTASGFKWVDVDFDGVYTPMKDIVVQGTLSAATNLVYTTDLLERPRFVGAGIDRGAYEVQVRPGTAVLFR